MNAPPHRHQHVEGIEWWKRRRWGRRRSAPHRHQHFEGVEWWLFLGLTFGACLWIVTVLVW